MLADWNNAKWTIEKGAFKKNWIEIIIKNETCLVKWPAKIPLKSKCDCCIASRWEKKTININPGINHNNMCERSVPPLKKLLKPSWKNARKIIKIKLTKMFIDNEDDAIWVLLKFSRSELTNFICAFFNSPDFVDSKIVVTIRNNAQTPICGFVRTRIKIMKLIRPNNVKENLCKKVKNADLIQ